MQVTTTSTYTAATCCTCPERASTPSGRSHHDPRVCRTGALYITTTQVPASLAPHPFKRLQLAAALHRLNFCMDCHHQHNWWWWCKLRNQSCLTASQAFVHINSHTRRIVLPHELLHWKKRPGTGQHVLPEGRAEPHTRTTIAFHHPSQHNTEYRSCHNEAQQSYFQHHAASHDILCRNAAIS